MKEYTERLLEIPQGGDPARLPGLLEKTAQKMADKGWYFVNAHTDDIMGSVCLCFERDLDETKT